jgi:hypothetical protein
VEGERRLVVVPEVDLYEDVHNSGPNQAGRQVSVTVNTCKQVQTSSMT